ncbi:MAG: D-alanyl-D-alanine carboxypeptidase [Butyrivibrio sp.]|nr:D-alanyl-D-alanine carboxypeptidase [Butyrivibrio sp.]
MKCTNKISMNKADSNKKNIHKKLTAGCILAAALVLTGCGSGSFEMPYDSSYPVSSFQLVQGEQQQYTVTPFAADLCVVDGDVSKPGVTIDEVGAAALFDLANHETLYAKNANTQIHPASLTKIMTALVALKYGSPDDVLKASENVIVTESGAVLCGIKPGDSMTLDQALHILLIYSANDVAILIAEGVGGTVEGFTELMNKEAQALGATNCNFLNPNGLTEEGHYVTAYDLYLIFAEAVKYDLFNEIIQMPSYTTTYMKADGTQMAFDKQSTNGYVRGDIQMPENITVIGGKTGTTKAAGHCLILLSRNSSGNPYISVIMNSDSTENLYDKMSELLNSINQ